MKKQLKRIGILQTSRVFAAIYFILTTVVLLPLSLIVTLTEVDFIKPLNGSAYLFIPIIYALGAFIITALGCALYNVVAQYIGGIEVEIESTNKNE